ncbi:hypothetical protein TNCV_2340001 [Trichonephila clavipes]|nr:hypothetical protein TNCV_2340001 [Trichonephila clavipes]
MATLKKEALHKDKVATLVSFPDVENSNEKRQKSVRQVCKSPRQENRANLKIANPNEKRPDSTRPLKLEHPLANP